MINVLVTGVGASGVGYQILSALRLAETEYNIVTADTTLLSRGLSLGSAQYILPTADSPDYLPSVIEICEKHRIQALFYGSEKELKVLSDNRRIFADMNVFLPLNPRELIDVCLDKNATMAVLKNNGFDIPLSFKISSENDIDEIDIFPVVLKPSIGGGGSANLMIAQNRSELQVFAKFLLQAYDEFIIQEYVGDAESEFTVGVLCDMQGNILNSIAMKRIIAHSFGNRLKVKNSTGKKELGDYLVVSSGLSQGWIGRFPDITGKCEKIAKALNATGAINIQCRAVGDKIYIFEINPRFSGTTSLRAIAGFNEPDVLVRKHILNEEIEDHFDYREGCILRSLEAEFVDTK